MAFEARHSDLLSAYHDKFGLPALDGASARDWTFKLGQQFNFTFPTEGWGTKKASSSSPQSTDVICTKNPFHGYDVILGQGTPTQSLNLHPDVLNLTGTTQVFIDTPAANYLDGQGGGNGNGGNGGGGGGTPVIPYDESKSVDFGHAINASGAPVTDPGMISVHSSRAAWDYYVGGLAWEDSKRKHVNEYRAVYGLPPV